EKVGGVAAELGKRWVVASAQSEKEFLEQLGGFIVHGQEKLSQGVAGWLDGVIKSFGEGGARAVSEFNRMAVDEMNQVKFDTTGVFKMPSSYYMDPKAFEEAQKYGFKVGEQVGVGADKGVNETAPAAADSLKAAFDAKSPYISVRVLFGNPQDVDKALESLGESVGRSLTGAKQSLINAGIDFGQSFVEGLSRQTGLAKELFKKDVEGFAQSFAKVNADLAAGFATSNATIRSVLLGSKTISAEFEKQMDESFVDLVLKANGLNKQLMEALYNADPAEFEKLNTAIQEQAKILAKSALDNIKHANGIATAITHIYHNAITPADRQYLLFAFGALTDGMEEAARAAGRAEQGIVESLGTIKAETRSFSQIVQEDLGRISHVFDEGLKLRGGVFDDLLPQLDHLAAASGQSTEQVAAQFRGMISELEATTPRMGVLVSQIDQYLLNSQLTKLEDALGKPLGRGIEAILDHFGKLKTGVAKQITAVGELFASLPDALGGRTVSKVISTINQYANLFSKALGVLDAFGVNLPGSWKKVLDIFTNGAGSTTQIMTDMKNDVVGVIRQMKDEILQIFDDLNPLMRAKFQEGLKSLTQAAQIELQSNTEVFQKWSKDVQITGADTAQKFGNSLFEGVGKININRGNILAGNAALFGGWAGKVTAAVLSVINISRQAGTSLPVIFSATANAISASSISMINSLQGLAAGAQTSLASFTDSAGQMQSGIGGLFRQISGLIFQAAGGAAQQANQAGMGIHQSLMSGILGVAAGGFMSGVGIGRATQSRLIGGIGGGLSGAAQGAIIGSVVPGIGTAVGAIVGGIAGTIGGILGGGKSAFQKAMEKEQIAQAQLQTKQAQQQYLQLVEGTKQSWLETISKGFALMEQIGATAAVPKSILKDAFKGLHQLTKFAIKELQSWKDSSIAELKPVAESLGSVFEALASGPAAVEAAARSIPVAQSSFDTFFSNVGKLWDGFGSFADGIKNKVRKHSEKFAESFKPVVEIVGPSVTAMADFFKVRRINEGDVGVWVSNITLIETGMAKAADSLDRFGVKDSARLAESGSTVLDFLSKYADTQDKIVGIKIPSPSDYDNLFTGAKLALGKAIEFAKDVAREGLQLASEVSNLGSSVIGSLNSEVEFIKNALALKGADFSSIPDTIKALWDATKLAVALASEAANSIDQELTDKAAKYAAGALDVMKLYGEAAKTFFGESTLVRDVYPAAVQNLTSGIELAILGIVDIRRRVTGEMLSEAQASATGINAAMSVISNAGSALKPLGIDEAGKAPTFSVQVIDNLLNITEYAIGRVVQLSKSTNKSDLAASVEYAGIVHGISTNMSDALGFIKAVAEQTPTSVSSFDLMVGNFSNFNTALARSEGMLGEGKGISARMVDIAHGIGGDLKEVARSLAASLTQTVGL
ncbi:MAG TPA: hypothetical protein VNI02_21785, partial [Blastocatellia bacterium]|nr:hypothetical protein [Blastocatellia bacterium]